MSTASVTTQAPERAFADSFVRELLTIRSIPASDLLQVKWGKCGVELAELD